MKLNKIELKKIMYSFNSISNRLLQANYEDYNTALFKFVSFLKDTDLIYEYIKGCGEYEKNIENEIEQVKASYGRVIFDFGRSDEEEVRSVFALLDHLVAQDLVVYGNLALGYSKSTKFQDMIQGFNNRVVMILIRHIERELTNIGIEMGMDEKVTYSITVENGQVNIANDSSVIHAKNNINTSELNSLIEDVEKAGSELQGEDLREVLESLEIIKQELSSEKPRKKILGWTMKGLKTIKGAGEFTAAVFALNEFLEPYL